MRTFLFEKAVALELRAIRLTPGSRYKKLSENVISPTFQGFIAVDV